MKEKNKKFKEKKKKSKAKKKSKRKHRSSSSDSDCNSSSESSEYEWVEKKSESTSSSREKSLPQDDWMAETLLSHTYSANDTRKDRKQNAAKDECIIADPGQSSRELNPYWKDGGTGLPEEKIEKNSDYQDAEWLKKALRRAKEQAKNENVSLETIAAERYGSLQNLYNLIDKAEARNSAKKSFNHERSHDRGFKKPSGYKETKNESSHSRGGFRKPFEDEEKKMYSSFEGYQRKESKGFRKPKPPERSEKIAKPSESPTSVDTNSLGINSVPIALTDQEMNSLASRILKAEMMGNTILVKELTDKLEAARKAREAAKNDVAKNNVVIVTNTNARGFTQPVRLSNEKSETKKRKTYNTHIAGERVRYFEDDDKYSLNEMYEKEMTQSVSDHNAEFLRLSAKSKGDKDYAVDDLFMEQSTSNRSEKERGLSDAIKKQQKTEKALDNCTWCLVNNKLQKHLIISTGTKSYLAVPFFQSLTEGHCLIVPMYHATCTTLMDEDVWEEMLKYCKHLVTLFRSKNQDVVFFETAFNFKNYPHLILHCVPVPYENGELLPIYFKKAIMECEKEWAQNKQVIDVQKLNVRKVIPKGLPYFMVHFGMDNGFAHVIEDEKRFPKNFAQEVIGGILDLDHHIWRKQQAENFEVQCQKVNQFKCFWKEIEFANSE